MSILHVEKKQKKLGEKKSTHLCIIIKIGLKYSIVVNQYERPFFFLFRSVRSPRTFSKLSKAWFI